MKEKHSNLIAGTLDEKVEANNPLKIQDLTFRDGHQSLFATRVRTEDLLPIAEEMDKVGFWAMEVWGGATFDSMHRFLAEDPWERIRILKKHIKNTPFSMLLRGQNLVGYRNYPDDVAEAFVERCCVNGIDVFRVFDALNDFRNFQTAVKVIKKNKKHFQGTICYSLTEERMGGPVYNLQYYLDKAKELEDMGADTICIKDMAGLMAPYDAYVLIKALKEHVSVPIHLHSHFTSGMADMTMLKAIEAGVDIIDVCLSPWAYRTSHPSIEPIVVALKGTNRDTGFDLKQLTKCAEHFNKISEKYRHLMDDRISVIDVNVLLHQIPGGMFSNLYNQLKQMDALDKLEDVLKELPRVRKELGQVPLVTPTSQIVGTQAVNNVLFDTPEERYKMITAQVKDLCYGLYGKTPAPIDPEVQKKALKGYPRGETPYTGRPADILEPELDKAKKDVEGLAKDIDDVLIYALYPTTGKKFLRWKYGLEEIPEELKPKSLEEIIKEREEKVMKKAQSQEATKRSFNVYINGEKYTVEIESADGMSIVTSLGAAPAAVSEVKEEKQKVKKEKEEEVSGTKVEAPMPGLIVRVDVEEGDEVHEGEDLLILEAMKMENAIPAPVSGVVKKILVNEGDNVDKGDVLVIIG